MEDIDIELEPGTESEQLSESEIDEILGTEYEAPGAGDAMPEDTTTTEPATDLSSFKKKRLAEKKKAAEAKKRAMQTEQHRQQEQRAYEESLRNEQESYLSKEPYSERTQTERKESVYMPGHRPERADFTEPEPTQTYNPVDYTKRKSDDPKTNMEFTEYDFSTMDYRTESDIQDYSVPDKESNSEAIPKNNPVEYTEREFIPSNDGREFTEHKTISYEMGTEFTDIKPIDYHAGYGHIQILADEVTEKEPVFNSYMNGNIRQRLERYEEPAQDPITYEKENMSADMGSHTERYAYPVKEAELVFTESKKSEVVLPERKEMHIPDAKENKSIIPDYNHHEINSSSVSGTESERTTEKSGTFKGTDNKEPIGADTSGGIDHIPRNTEKQKVNKDENKVSTEVTETEAASGRELQEAAKRKFTRDGGKFVEQFANAGKVIVVTAADEVLSQDESGTVEMIKKSHHYAQTAADFVGFFGSSDAYNIVLDKDLHLASAAGKVDELISDGKLKLSDLSAPDLPDKLKELGLSKKDIRRITHNSCDIKDMFTAREAMLSYNTATGKLGDKAVDFFQSREYFHTGIFTKDFYGSARTYFAGHKDDLLRSLNPAGMTEKELKRLLKDKKIELSPVDRSIINLLYRSKRNARIKGRNARAHGLKNKLFAAGNIVKNQFMKIDDPAVDGMRLTGQVLNGLRTGWSVAGFSVHATVAVGSVAGKVVFKNLLSKQK